MEQVGVEACYMCGMPLEEGQGKLLFSDMRTECGTRWEMKRYCFGEGTHGCAIVPEAIRRGPLFEAISNITPFEGEDIDSLDQDWTEDDDACDEQ